jgi:murein DD-endopeptidase MepM/ murein hydrolase activator NlpD
VAFVAAVDQQRREAAEKADREARAALEEKRNSHRWVLPVNNFRLSAGFGSSGRMWSSTHTGTDFAAPSGTNVSSASSGEIVEAESAGAYGNRIIVRHWDGTETWYCHLSRFVKRSGSVGAGEVIGHVGSTGNTTGPHLHFEVHPDGGDPVNPRSWLQSQGLKV